MEAIEQLKTLRNDALQRLQGNPDYKVLTSLDNLLSDLESVTRSNRPTFMIIEEEEPEEANGLASDEDTDSVDEAFEKITAELEIDDDDDDEQEDKGSRPIMSFN